MENEIIQAGKDPQASAHTDRCSEVPSNFPHLPSTRTTESELWTQALSFLLCLVLFFHLLNLFLLFFQKQTRREILLKPSTNHKSTESHPSCSPFLTSHSLLTYCIGLSGTLFQPCLPHRFRIFFNDFSFPPARVKGSAPIATCSYLCHNNCYPIVFQPLDNLSVSYHTHNTVVSQKQWFCLT